MNEAEVMATETEEIQMSDSDFDAGWDDNDSGFDSADQTVEKDEAEEPVVEEKEPEAPDVEKQTADVEAKDGTQEQLYTLKNKVTGDRNVTLEEMQALAQKGSDYDRVQQERDQLRAYKAEAEPAMALVKSAAARSNMTVTQYLDYVRKQELMLTGINEETAQAQLEIEKQRAEITAIQEEQRKVLAEEQRKKEEEERQAEARREDINKFRKSFPDVDAGKIPEEVWAQVRSGLPLTAAYALHKARALEAELAAERQNKEARAKSTGSMTTAGEKAKDLYDDGWYDD